MSNNKLFNHSKPRPLKQLGQNFLIDENAIESIIKGSLIDNNSYVLEIGPGQGALTDKLANMCRGMIAVELDSNLALRLQNRYQSYQNLFIVNDDILNVNIPRLFDEYFRESPLKIDVIGNLPYYITSPIITRILEFSQYIRSFTLMVQKEVAERLLASPHGRDIGYLTHHVGYFADCFKICDVNKELFFPVPKVDSCAVRLEILSSPRVDVISRDNLFSLIKAAFSNRRKTILNSLCNSLSAPRPAIENALAGANIEPSARAEELTLQDYANLSDLLQIVRG